MPVFVYAIYSASHNIVYVGMAKDVNVRITEHNAGKSKYTQSYKPWVLFYQESHSSYAEARMREKQLKNHSGKTFLRERLRDFHS